MAVSIDTSLKSNVQPIIAAEAWNVGSVYETVHKVDNMSEAVVDIESTENDAVEKFFGVLESHAASVVGGGGGYGGRDAKVSGYKFFIEAPTDQMVKIGSDIKEKFPISPPVEQSDVFKSVNRWIANNVISARVDRFVKLW
jgi:hypothetical protein